MMLRLAAWVISFLYVAKAESKLFIKLELSANFTYLIFSLLGYKMLGLTGLGIAFSLQYVVYFIQVYFIAKKRYEFRFSDNFIKCYGIHLLLVILCLVFVMILNGWLKYLIGSFVIFISCYLGIRGLNQRMNLLELVKNKNTRR